MHEFATYFKRHTALVVFVGFFGFLTLAIGEYALLRSQLYINKMLSEGLMQIKEDKQNYQTSVPYGIKNDSTKKVLGACTCQ